MLKRYIGIVLVIIGALIMLSTFIFFSGVEYERYIRIFGGFLFFLGTLIIPKEQRRKVKVNKKA